jgi:hypothetical protein
MVNLSRPPLPLNKVYRQPFNYPEYVKDYDPYVHVGVFLFVIKANGETKDAKIVNLFSFTLRNIMYNWYNN